MAMTEARRNEIAWDIVVDKAKRSGLPNFKPNDFKREMGNKAKDLGLSIEEVKEFAKMLYGPLFEEYMKETREGAEGVN